uniref:Xenotropic and polytropic retrovirus receptor 1 n=1 Tax=Cacopsylla melanoneura TaxID=428564 RepID=A0A8D8XEH9_9HEMI
MKFAEHLTAHITPEWRKQYISYEEMKALLYQAIEEAPSLETTEQEVIARYFKMFDENFFVYCDKELKKINLFYSEKLAEATRKFSNLRNELKRSQEESMKSTKSKKKPAAMLLSRHKTDVPARKLQELKLAFSEYYLSLILLQNYQNLNFTGFRKILKKHDKLLNVDVGARWRAEHVDVSHFYVNKDINHLIAETEATVTLELEDGDRQKAMKRLRVPPLGEQQSPWTTFKVGLFLGCFAILFAIILLKVFFDASQTDFKMALRLYRGPLLIIQFIFLMGVNVYGWRSSGVNHVLIFELDPRNHLSEQHLMEISLIMGNVWALSLLCFLFSNVFSIPPYSQPAALLLIMFAFLLNPSRTLKYDARFWLLRVTGRMVAAPFFHVGFADFWLADQLNSLTVALLDFYYLICFYSNNDSLAEPMNQEFTPFQSMLSPVMSCVPAWIRFMQCLRRYRDSKEAFPHLANAGKYSTTFFVVVFAYLFKMYKVNDQSVTDNPFFYPWLAASIVSSIYSYVWDIKMDWGLFDKNAPPDNPFLREETVYSSTGFYYFAILEDLTLRFSWLCSFFLVHYGNFDADTLLCLTGPLEVFRRFIWNYLRLEYEHININNVLSRTSKDYFNKSYWRKVSNV